MINQFLFVEGSVAQVVSLDLARFGLATAGVFAVAAFMVRFELFCKRSSAIGHSI